MSKRSANVVEQIGRVRALGPDYGAVANLAEIGLAVVEAVRKAGGIPRQRKAAVLAPASNGAEKPSRRKKQAELPVGGDPLA